MSKSQNDVDLEIANVGWAGLVPYYLLKKVFAPENIKEGLLLLDDVICLFLKVKRQLLALARPELGKPRVALDLDFQKIRLIYDDQHQERLALATRNDLMSSSDGDRPISETLETTTVAAGRSRADEIALEEEAVQIAVGILDKARDGNLPTAEEFSSQVAASPDPGITMAVLARSNDIPFTIAGSTRVFDVGGKGRFPKTLTSSRRFTVKLAGFMNVNATWMDAFIVSVDSTADSALVMKYFRAKQRCRIELGGGPDDMKLRFFAIFSQQITATVIATIETGSQRLHALTLLKLEDTEKLRIAAATHLQQIQRELHLDETPTD